MNILKRPMFYASVAAAVVAAFSLYYLKFTWVIVAVAFCLMLFGIVKGGAKYIGVLVVFLLFVISLFCEYKKIDTVNTFDGKRLSGEFVVVSEADEYEGFNTFTVRVTKSRELPQNTKYLIFDYSKLNISSGDILSATVKISAIEYGDKYRFYDYGNGVYATASVVSAEKSGRANDFYKFCGSIRKYVKERLKTHDNGDTVGLLIALTTGDKSALSDNFLSGVKTTGVSHIIVVSGLHLSIIMSGVFSLLDRLFYNKYARSLISVVIIALISGVCGFTMSVIRAGVMFVVAGIAPVFNRENDSLNSLFMAVSLVLIATPFAIVNISFWLSVLSTLSIIWVAPFYTSICIEKFNISSKILKIILNIFFCSLFAMIFTMPVTVKNFGYVSVVAPFTNLAITYPITIALIFNVVALLFSAIPILKILSYTLFRIAALCSRFIVFIVNKIVELPVTVAILPDSALVFSIFLIATVITFMNIYEFKLKRKRSDTCVSCV